ncbi:MAG TPA: EamA family transporter RarD [Allosphingosinicella sp.]|jgi:chloramphenicol-sensitive protein RarD
MTARTAAAPPRLSVPRFSEATAGVLLGLGAYFSWGFLPIYMKAVGAVAAPEILANRILWSVVLLAGLIAVTRRWAPVAALVRAPRTMAVLALTALLIAVNWLVYIWAVNAGFVLQTSLAYFVTPLVNVLLGVVVLREKLRLPQKIAVGFAAAGVAVLALGQGGLPWIVLVLAFSFSVYGLLRKMAPVDPLTGLFGETAMLAPLALFYVAVFGAHGFGRDAGLDVLLVVSGVVTAAPLLMFAAAAKRLNYSTMGLLQYTAPTIQFLLAILLYGEPLTGAHMITFALIWTALIVYAADSLNAARRAA